MTTNSGTLRHDDDSTNSGTGTGTCTVNGSASRPSTRPPAAPRSPPRAQSPADEPVRWSIVRQATLKRLKESRSPFAKVAASERFFVLKEAPLEHVVPTRCPDCQGAVRAYEAGLEYRTRFALDVYESEKKFRKLGPTACRKSIDLLGLFHVKCCAYAKFKHCLSLYTDTASVHVAFANDEQLHDWYQTLNEMISQLVIDAQQSSAPYTIDCDVCAKHTEFWANMQHSLLRFDFVCVWEVTTKNKDLAQTRRELAGRWRLALTENEVLLIRINEQTVVWTFQIPCIRSCTHYLDNTFALDLGRAAPTGEGRLYFDMFDEQDAKNVHDSLFGKMNSCSQRAGLDQRATSNVGTRRRRTRPATQQLTATTEQTETHPAAVTTVTPARPLHSVDELQTDDIRDMSTSASETPTPLAGARGTVLTKRASQKSCGTHSVRLNHSRVGESVSVSNASSSLSVVSNSLPRPLPPGSSKHSLVSTAPSDAPKPLPSRAQPDPDRPVELRANFASHAAANRVSLDVPPASSHLLAQDATVGDPFRKRSISDTTRQQPYSHLAPNTKSRGSRHHAARPVSGQTPAALVNVEECVPLSVSAVDDLADADVLLQASSGSSPSTSIASGLQTASRRGSHVSVMTASAAAANDSSRSASRSQLYCNADPSVLASLKSQHSVVSGASQQLGGSSRRSSGASRLTLGTGPPLDSTVARLVHEGVVMTRKSTGAPAAHLTPSHSGGPPSVATSGRSSALEDTPAPSEAAASCDYLEMSPGHTAAPSMTRSATGESRSPLPAPGQSVATAPCPLSQSSLATSNQLISNGSLADPSLSDALSSASACSPVIGVGPVTVAQRRYTTGDASSLLSDRTGRFRSVNTNAANVADQAARAATEHVTSVHVHPPPAGSSSPRPAIRPPTTADRLTVDACVDADYNRLKERSHSVGSASLLRVRPPLNQLHVRRAIAQQRAVAAAAAAAAAAATENDRSSSSLSSAHTQPAPASPREPPKACAPVPPAAPAGPLRGPNGGMINTLANLFSGHPKQRRERDRASQKRLLATAPSCAQSPTQASAHATSIDTVATPSPPSSSAGPTSTTRSRRQHSIHTAPHRSATLVSPSSIATAPQPSNAQQAPPAANAMIFNNSKQNEMMEVSFSPRAARVRPHTTICSFNEAAGDERLLEQEGEAESSLDAQSPTLESDTVTLSDQPEHPDENLPAESYCTPNTGVVRARADSNPESAVHSIRPNTVLVHKQLPAVQRKASGTRSSLKATLRDILRLHSNSSTVSPSTSTFGAARWRDSTTTSTPDRERRDAQEPMDAYVLLNKPENKPALTQPTSDSGADADDDTYLPLGPADFSRERHDQTSRLQPNAAVDAPQRTPVQPVEEDFDESHDYANVGFESVARELKWSPNEIRALVNLQSTLSSNSGANSSLSLGTAPTQRSTMRYCATATTLMGAASRSNSRPPGSAGVLRPAEPASASSECRLHYATLEFGTSPQTGLQSVSRQHRLSGSAFGVGACGAPQPGGGHRSLVSVSSGGQLIAGALPLGRPVHSTTSSSSSNSNSAEYAAPVFPMADRPFVPLKSSLSVSSTRYTSTPNAAAPAKTLPMQLPPPSPVQDDALYVDLDVRHSEASK